jgi:hypothetical protein
VSTSFYEKNKKDVIVFKALENMQLGGRLGQRKNFQKRIHKLP